MKIKKMTATFGALDHAVLEPGEGLTVITAPNESGKSTWAGFLRAMLYGVNTRERDKEGYLAEKNRYAPWSGAPMEGEVQLTWRGEEITLRRFAKRTSPFGGFQAVYTATGDPVPGLTAEEAGELLVGAGRELYERTAFVSQGGAAVTGSAELERRIAALASSGEEVSFTETQRTLKDWLNRRRANRANGLLPALDEEIAQTRAALAAIEREREESGAARRRLDELEEERRELADELELHRRIRQQQLDRRYAQAKLEWQAAVAAIPSTEPHPRFGEMTGEEAWESAMEAVRAKEAAEAENRTRQQKKEWLTKQEKKEKRLLVKWFLLIALLVAVAVAVPVIALPWYTLLCLLPIAIPCVIYPRRLLKRRKLIDAEWANLVPVPVPDPGDMLEQAAAYRESMAKAERAKATAQVARRLVDELAAQGGRDHTTLEFLHAPQRPPLETQSALRTVEEEMARIRRSVDIAQGREDTLGDLDALYSKLDTLCAQRAERQREYDALNLAMEALADANDHLRKRFSPELNRRAGELFARLSGGEYAALELTRTFEASAVPAGEVLPRSALSLSRGTVEQLYLAVRLALCELTLSGEEKPPLVLDDALVNFDDRRMELALELLQELAQDRQILLFSCHSREAQWAKGRPVTVCRLQSAGE